MGCTMPPIPAQNTLAEAITYLPEGRVLVAVSGGPDSVALLLALIEAGREVAVGHVNHSLRGDESDQDAAFVQELGTRLGVSVTVERADTRAEARRMHSSIETAARDFRYAALRKMLATWGGDFIATGHTQDDQAETVLMHLIRGSGAAGLGGMQRVQGRIVRPFLDVSRKAVLQWLAERGQPYRLDASNLDTQFTRNQIRAGVIPALRAINPQVTGRIATTARTLRADADFLEDQARKALAVLTISSAATRVVVDRTGWASLHPAMARRVAREVIRTVLGDVSDIDERHIMTMVHAVSAGSSALGQLPREIRLEADEQRVAVSVGPPGAAPPLQEAGMPVPGEITLPGGTMRAELLYLESGALAALLAVVGPFHALLDAAAAGTDLRIRARRPGDRIKPTGFDGTRKVQDMMVDARVPSKARATLPIVTNTDHVVWIPGLAVDRRAAAGPESRHILHLVWTPSAAE